MSKVYLVPSHSADPEDVLARKLSALFVTAGLRSCFGKKDLAALKVHVGEPGTKTFTSPSVAAELVRLVAATGAQPFLTDTAVLYKSPRDNGVGHSRVAEEHGFTLNRVGAPFVPADGLTGSDAHEVPIDGKHYDRVSIASAILHARSLLVLTHATGHLGTGFGGALKNLGMGCSSKKAKLRQHHGQNPEIDSERCRGCAVCAEWCPSGAIEVLETAEIDQGKCIGCGECLAACLEGAVTYDWSVMGRDLSERIVEHAVGVARGKPGRIGYVTVATDITKNCDCLGVEEEPVVEDIGIFASKDPVAIDRAVLDLVRERAGRTLEALTYPDRDASYQIEYAEAVGLGESAYELVTVQE